MSSIPKFGSFKPKEVTSKQRAEERPERQRDQRSASSSRKQHADHHRHGRRRHKNGSEEGRQHRTHHPDRREQSPSRLHKHEPDKAIIVPDETEESDLFMIDRRGDSKNVEFGSLHRYSVPAYHRFGHGRLVGAVQSIRLDRDQDTGKFAVLSTVTDKDRARVKRPLYSKQLATSERKFRLVAPVTTPSNELLQPESDFIALRPGLKRKRRSASPEHGHVVDYRSIEGKAKAPTSPSDSDLASGSGSGSEECGTGKHQTGVP
ncbi:hypothetical protein EJ03DRAFT_349936 [Teratosphaeria nubilosa]|uniref:Uncharacterized protein n=1 Tax=Teratosphaeria nubilosa TaxID=161662 RepID=A0A6G1LDE0_9PEZI|nr:hypothetical protein EJ03DRAFT_349936 [Teratosphaeria nubilosa]